MKLTCIVILAISILSSCSAQMKFVENPEKGTLTLFDGRTSVLTYCYGNQLKEGLNPRHTRSCYIHPLFALDGRVLTDDFPKDHLHHHGISWTWPVVKTRGLDTQTWHSVTPSLRQYFVRWVEREAGNSTATLRAEAVWKLESQETVARENITLHVLPADNFGRAIDLELKIQAVGGTLELQGAPDQNKGYGGLNFRAAPIFKGAALTTDQGSLKKDSVNVSFRWADMSIEELGVAIFVSPDHPGFPTTWLIRNSYAGILNASWPGLEPVILQPEKPILLRYRLYIHHGDARAGRVREAYERFLKSLR